MLEKAGNINGILKAVQASSACHLKYANMLKQTIETAANDEIKNNFHKVLKLCLQCNYKEKNPYVNKLMEFYGVFFTCWKCKNSEGGEVHPFLNEIIEILLKFIDVCNDSCRYWSCKLLAKIFDNLEEISDDMYHKLQETFLCRLKDPIAIIRFQALLVSHRLQDPCDKYDPFVTTYCHMLQHEINAKIRNLCVEKIVFNKYSLPIILTRIRDIDTNVRLSAFKRLSKTVKYLTIKERRKILKSGFLDSDEKVQNFICNDLINDWIEEFDNDLLKLMKAIRFDACDDDIQETVDLIEIILKSAFQSLSAEKILEPILKNKNKLFSFEELNWETSIYLFYVHQYLRQSEDYEHIINSILPDLTEFCQYIKKYYEFALANNENNLTNKEHQFILKQLFQITFEYDVADVTSRQKLNSLIHNLLLNADLETSTAEILVKNLERTIPDIHQRSIMICEIISNIRDGETSETQTKKQQLENEKCEKISKIKEEIKKLNEIEKECIKTNNFLEAERIKNETEAKEIFLHDLINSEIVINENPPTDNDTILRYLTITESLLGTLKISYFNPALATLNSEIIQPALGIEDNKLRAKVFRCYAMCCLRDRRSAKYGIHLFSAAIIDKNLQNDCDDNILIICIKAVVDLLRIYGPSLIDDEVVSLTQPDSERIIFQGGTSLGNLIKGLVDLLNHEEVKVQEVATKAICILILKAGVISENLLSQLVVKWANPLTDDGMTKQFIGHTLKMLPSIRDFTYVWVDTILATMKTLVYAPETSPLIEIDVMNVGKMMIALCQLNKGTKVQDILAIRLCQQMLEKPKKKIVSIYAKFLPLLQISESDNVKNNLLELCDDLRDNIRDKLALKYIEKFVAILNRLNVNNNNL